MADSRDPFRTLDLAYDAAPEDVRQAFRRLARSTHPDRGGSATAFHEVRVAYSALTNSLEDQRRLWRPAPEAPRSRHVGGLDPRVYPTCPVRTDPPRPGRPSTTYDVSARPEGWAPGPVAPPEGQCVAHVAATPEAPAFGVWTVPLDAHRFRCVFGPAPPGG